MWSVGREVVHQKPQMHVRARCRGERVLPFWPNVDVYPSVILLSDGLAFFHVVYKHYNVRELQKTGDTAFPADGIVFAVFGTIPSTPT